MIKVEKRRKIMINILIYISIIAVLIVVDQISKYIAFKHLPFSTNVKCLPGLFRVCTTYNDGAMFGLFEGMFTVFYITTFIGLGLFIFMMKHADFQKYPFYTIGLLLMIAGTIGNFIDRVAFKQVRDFLTFDFFEFAIFNFADMCMTCGIILLAIDVIFSNVGNLWK